MCILTTPDRAFMRPILRETSSTWSEPGDRVEVSACPALKNDWLPPHARRVEDAESEVTRSLGAHPLLAFLLVLFGCGGGDRPPPRSSPSVRASPTFVDTREPSCPGGIPARRPDDLAIELEREGERWLIVGEASACAPDVMDTMTPPLGWDHAARRCATVPTASLDRLYRELVEARVDRIRIRRPDPLPSGRAFALRWTSASCRVGAVARVTQIHPDDRALFESAMTAIEAILASRREAATDGNDAP